MITLCGFGVSNYYNKIKVFMLEKDIPFQEATVYPWERDDFLNSSPLGRIPYIETEDGDLSESEVILEYFEERFTEHPLLPSGCFPRAKCRELIQHIELNVEWVARRLYKEAFFGGRVSDDTKQEVREKLVNGLAAVGRLAKFSPFVFGADFTTADCVAFFHLDYVRQASLKIYGEDLLEDHLPEAASYLLRMESRPHFRTTVADRALALATFLSLNVPYEG